MTNKRKQIIVGYHQLRQIKPFIFSVVEHVLTKQHQTYIFIWINWYTGRNHYELFKCI